MTEHRDTTPGTAPPRAPVRADRTHDLRNTGPEARRDLSRHRTATWLYDDLLS